MKTNLDIFKQYLNVYYKYPAAAVWKAVELYKVSQLKIKDPVLDLCCCDGIFSSFLFKNKIECGIDLSFNILPRAKKTNIYKHIINADAGKLPFKNNFFSTIISICALEHVVNLSSALKEISRVLKPNGKLIFTVPSYNFKDYMFYSKLFRKFNKSAKAKEYEALLDKLLDIHHCYSVEKWEEYLNKVNLTIETIEYYMPGNVNVILDLIDRGIDLRIPTNFDILYGAIKKIVRLVLYFPENIQKKIWYLLLAKYYKQALKPELKNGAGLLIVAKKKE